jgi:hypothetical protein
MLSVERSTGRRRGASAVNGIGFQTEPLPTIAKRASSQAIEDYEQIKFQEVAGDT